MASGTFGDLRSLLNATPSKSAWDAVCAEVRRWAPDRFEAEVLPYTLRHLERWPPEVRECRTFWLLDILRRRPRGEHVTCLASTVSLGRSRLTQREWHRFVLELDWRSLRSLSLFEAILPAGWFSLLTSAPWFPKLESLTLPPMPDELTSLHDALMEGELRQVKSLNLGSVGVVEDTAYCMTQGADWPALQWLSLGGHYLHEDAFVSVLTSSAFPALQFLDLTFSRRGYDDPNYDEDGLPSWFHVGMLDMIQAAPWFAGLERLELFWGNAYRPRRSNVLDWVHWAGQPRPWRAHLEEAHIAAYFMEERARPLLRVLGWGAP